MPLGKAAGVRCTHLTADNFCAIYDLPDRSGVCIRMRASEETCGRTSDEAFKLLTELERLTRPSGR